MPALIRSRAFAHRMAWPFSRRGKPAEPAKEPRVLSDADRAVVSELQAWLQQNGPDVESRLGEDGDLYVFSLGEEEDPFLLARVRKGKLVRLEVRDESVRPLAGRIVKAFEKKGLWSFNGLVRLMDAEATS